MPRVLIIDIETESDVDLREVTTAVFAEHHSTRVERVGWAFGDTLSAWKPEETRGVPPAELIAATEACDLIAAFNADFDFTVIERKLPDWGIPKNKITCLMHRTMASGIRKKSAGDSAIGLADAAVLAGAPELLRKFPQELVDATGYSWLKSGNLLTTPDEREIARDAYVLQDVKVARWLDENLPALSPFEIECFQSCRAMNAAGMPVDRQLLGRAHDLGKMAVERAEARFTERTGLRATQREKVKNWFASQGLELEDMRRETLVGTLDAGNVPADLEDLVLDFIDVSAKPYQRFAEMLRLTSPDDRLRGTLVHAVAHTGRDVGRGVNLQNAKRPSLDREGQVALAEFVRDGAGIEAIELGFGSPSLAVSDLQRAVFMTPEGYSFADGDFTRAEPMVGFWLTGEQDGAQPYHEVGAKIANGMRSASKSDAAWRANPIIENMKLPADVAEVTVAHISKSSTLYTVAKAAFLGAGYGQQAAGLLKSLAARGIAIPKEVADAATKACRDLKPKTFRLAEDVLLAFGAACAGRKTELADGKLVVRPYALGVEIALPSGRAIRYRNMRAHYSVGAFSSRRLTVTYTPGFEKTSTGKPLVESVHAGTVLENVFSGIARDFLYDAINRAVAAGIEVVLGIHDQILAVVSTERERKLLEDIMNSPPSWSRGFAMKAEVELSRRFLK